MPHRPSTADSRRTQVPPLTSVRFFAALYVAVFHMAPTTLHHTPVAAEFVEGGYIGVSFFFVLSGFVLAWNYLDRFAAGRTTSREFWRARFARVYPVYLVGLAVSLPLFAYQSFSRQHTALGTAGEIGRAAALNFPLIQSWFPKHALVWNAPSWSLSVEAFFYASFPLLVAGIIALPHRRILPAIAIAWVLMLVGPTAYNLLRPDGVAFPSYEFDAFWVNALKYAPLPHLLQFLTGVLGAKWLLERGRRPAGGRGPDVTWPVLALGALALATLMLGARTLYLYLETGLLAPVFLAIILLLTDGDGALVRWLSRPSLVLLGEASYALYLVHMPVGEWLGTISRRTHLPVAPWTGALGFTVYLVVALALSICVLRWIEEPARRAIRDARLPRLRWRVPPTEATAGVAVSPEG